MPPSWATLKRSLVFVGGDGVAESIMKSAGRAEENCAIPGAVGGDDSEAVCLIGGGLAAACWAVLVPLVDGWTSAVVVAGRLTVDFLLPLVVRRFLALPFATKRKRWGGVFLMAGR